jgi:hypothetical protein
MKNKYKTSKYFFPKFGFLLLGLWRVRDGLRYVVRGAWNILCKIILGLWNVFQKMRQWLRLRLPYLIKPFIVELFIYIQLIFIGAILIFVFVIGNYFIKFLPAYKLEEIIFKLWESAKIAALYLFGLHLVTRIVFAFIIEEDKDGNNFWAIRSIDKALFFRGFEFIFLFAAALVTNFYLPEWNLFVVLVFGIEITIISFNVHEETIFEKIKIWSIYLRRSFRILKTKHSSDG